MFIFKFLSSVLGKKEIKTFASQDEEKEFSPYMLNRWVSMRMPQMASLLNSTANRHWNIPLTKRGWVTYYNLLIPSVPYKKIEYLKKPPKKGKAEKNVDSRIIEMMATSMEISKREVEAYIKEFNIDVKEIKKALTN